MADPLIGADLVDWQANDPDQAVEDALAAVRSYCGWHIAPSQVDTVTLNAGYDCTFLLPSLHVTAVTSVTANGSSLLSTAYEWSTAGVLRLTTAYYYHRYPWTTLRNLVVQMTHGYDTLPGDLRQVVLALADRGSSPANIRQVGDIVLATSAADARAGSVFTESQRATLNRYKLPTLA